MNSGWYGNKERSLNKFNSQLEWSSPKTLKRSTYNHYYAKCKKINGESYCIQRLGNKKFLLMLFESAQSLGVYSKLRYAKNAAERHNSQ